VTGRSPGQLGRPVAAAARGYSGGHEWIAFWTVCAVVGGPLFGWAGWTWRRGAGRMRAAGAALLPATFLAEGTGGYGPLLDLLAGGVIG
jgi:Family of unknown function (DUF6518)